MSDEVSPFCMHFSTGQWHRVLSQDRVEGTVMFLDFFPDDPNAPESEGRYFRVTVKVIAAEEFTP